MTSTFREPRIVPTDRARLALAVADAGWYTTGNLFAEVPTSRASTLLLRCNDVRVAWSKGQRPWNWNRPVVQDSPGRWNQNLVLPSGWMKTYPRIGMRPIARAIRDWRSRLSGDGPLALVMTYPYYLHLADLTWPDRLIYFNEPQTLPAPAPADIAHLPRPLIGYVGTLEDRVDWALMNRVAETNPTGSIVLVGRVGGDGDASWQRERSNCLARPNVHAIGWRDQAGIDAYNRSFDLGLIPYRVDHPFNLACCPTKIMDYMASGRPVVSTDLPECRLYPDLFDVVESGGFAEAVAGRLAAGPDDGRASLRLDHARANSCEAVVNRLLDWVDRA
jgi:glycosyltransferase involved in cell wall biosynthesis